MIVSKTNHKHNSMAEHIGMNWPPNFSKTMQDCIAFLTGDMPTILWTALNIKHNILELHLEEQFSYEACFLKYL